MKPYERREARKHHYVVNAEIVLLEAELTMAYREIDRLQKLIAHQSIKTPEPPNLKSIWRNLWT